MRALKSYGIALVLVVIVAAWLSTGVLIRGGQGPGKGEVTVVSALESEGGLITDAVARSGLGVDVHHQEGADDPALSIAARAALADTENGPARNVRVRHYEILPMPLEVSLRGQTAAESLVKVVAQTSDIVLTVDVVDGQRVDIGDRICTLENGTRLASVEQARASYLQAEAALAQAQNDSNVNARLRERGIESSNSAEGYVVGLSAAEANLHAAAVNVSNKETELANTEITATVAGIIQRPLAEVGDLMMLGGSCASIIQLDPMKFVGAVPQSRIDLAKLGLSAEIRTINGSVVEGTVSYVAVSSDPATRSFAIEIEFANPDHRILDGITAEATVSLGFMPAHLLPQSIMTLDENGRIGVRTVEDRIVVFYPITILQDTRDGIWVTGLPNTIDVIVLGQEYVKAGQSVIASAEE
ncbi:MAG: efflux RND transporter periplasmic adaptor subunit [Rhodobacteraceae bacterium]|nr:efflux RND transporter periplasmic adaptor subunit [Paracoccaceae bacterium]